MITVKKKTFSRKQEACEHSKEMINWFISGSETVLVTHTCGSKTRLIPFVLPTVQLFYWLKILFNIR